MTPPTEISWSPRVSKARIRRLYLDVSRDLWDTTLIDDVGTTLYLRCRDILRIHRAVVERKITCPHCDRATGTETLIPTANDLDTPIVCPVCKWSVTWRSYHRSWQRKQLNSGGAAPFFQRFLHQWNSARSPQQKVLAIDLLIHEFHYSIRELPDQPSRACAVNLIEGNLTEVLAFLNELSGLPLPAEFQQVHTNWTTKQNSIQWKKILAEKAAHKQPPPQESA